MPNPPHDFDPIDAFPRPRKDIGYVFTGRPVELPRGMSARKFRVRIP
jgi:hypothetical protein